MFSRPTIPSYLFSLSLHDALPILHEPDGVREPRRRGEGDGAARPRAAAGGAAPPAARARNARGGRARADRKSTRLNSSHLGISYAVFCLKKKTSINAMIYFVPTLI